MGKINFKGAGKRIVNRAGGGLAGGAVGFGMDKIGSGWNPWIRIGIKAVAGAALPEIAPKSEFMSHAGAGLVACGAQDMGHQLLDGTAGVGDAGDEKEYVVDVDTTSGAEENNALGNPEEDALGYAEQEEEEYERD